MASAVATSDITISSLRGGMNDQDPASTLPDDQCVFAMNVEFYYSALGERRLGCYPMDITGSGLDKETTIAHLSQRFPFNDMTLPEYWAIAMTPGASTSVARRDTLGVWSVVTPIDPILPAVPDAFNIQAQSLHQKHFLTYPNSRGRMHVWDGSTLRPTGLSEPAAAPTAADEGSGSTYTTVRYFRVRYIVKNGTQISLRSEPSDSVTFTPSGSGAGATVTRPALINEGETDWELEASTDDANFYLLSTLPIATTTSTDTVPDFPTGDYADSGPLSEAIGSYLLQSSARFVIADEDRLILAGDWFDLTRQSLVMWSPPFTDPGVGNDERLPISTTGGQPIDSTQNLDGNEGGQLTGLSQIVSGSFFVFKWQAIYQATRTQDPTRAYDIVNLTKQRGAVPGSVVNGVDEYGRACTYFLDPFVGPSRLGVAGLEVIRGLRKIWKRVNLQPSEIIARGVYYPDKSQVRWWVAADGSQSPQLGICLQTDQIVDTGNGTGRGWSLFDGRLSQAQAVAAFNLIVATPDGSQTLSCRPFIGLTAPDFIQVCDNADTDAGQGYIAEIITRPYFSAGLLNQWEAMTSALLADANPAANVQVSYLRDFSIEESQTIVVNLAPVATESQVIKQFDNLAMAEAYSIQFKFIDPP